MRVCLMRAEHLIGGDVVNDWTNPHCFFSLDCIYKICFEYSWLLWNSMSRGFTSIFYMGVLNKYQIISILNENEWTNKQRSQWKYQSNRLQRSNEFERIQMKKKTTTLIISKSTVNFVDYSVFVINRSMITIVWMEYLFVCVWHGRERETMPKSSKKPVTISDLINFQPKIDRAKPSQKMTFSVCLKCCSLHYSTANTWAVWQWCFEVAVWRQT